MIKYIWFFGLYEDFIKIFPGDSVFADLNFEFDNENLYNSLLKDNKKTYIVLEGEKVNGLFVWVILPNKKGYRNVNRIIKWRIINSRNTFIY